MSVQIVSPERAVEILTIEIESKQDKIAELKESNARANLRIIAKDMQIAELTRMLFALGKQDGQTIRTQAAEIERLTEKVRYAYVQIEALEKK